jgi:hypothetical protein
MKFRAVGVAVFHAEKGLKWRSHQSLFTTFFAKTSEKTAENFSLIF